MADVLNRTTLQFLKSVNTTDYPTIDWVHNPDMSSVAGVPPKYWKLIGDAPVEMTQVEKDAVDAAVLLATVDGEMSQIDAGTLRRLVLALIDELNVLRTAASLSLLTITDLKASMRSK